jgi:hypothetical protein
MLQVATEITAVVEITQIACITIALVLVRHIIMLSPFRDLVIPTVPDMVT